MNNVRNKEYLSALGNNLRAIRKKQKISQAQLAFEAGIPREQISRIELGKVNPTVTTIYAVSKALNVTISEILDIEI